MGEYSEIDVSPDMIRAGVDVLIESGRTITDYEVLSDSALVEQIFLAMLDRLHETPKLGD